MIQVIVEKNKAWTANAETLTSGSIGVNAKLDFTSDWDNLSAFAIFSAYDVSAAVPVSGSTVEIPASVLAKPNVNLLLGVYGISTDGKIAIPTVYADLGIVREGANLSGAENYTPPTEALSAQILALAKAAQSAAATAVSGEYAGSVTFSINSSGHLIMTVTEDEESTDTDLGGVSAYAAAVAGGYTGTYAEFKALLIANYSTSQDVAAALAAVEEVTDTAAAAASAASSAVTTANAASSAASSASSAASAAQAAAAAKQAQHKTATVTLAGGNSSWTDLSVTGVTASNTVIVTPAPASFNAWVQAGIYCSAQGSGTLSFSATSQTTADITANVLILD